MSDDKKQIGRILLKRRLISPEELDKQLDRQRSAADGVPLASRIAASGVVSETEVLRALSEQFGVPGIDLNQVAIPIGYLDLVPRDLAEASLILPVLARDERLFLATANPSEKKTLDEIEFVTGRKVYPYVAITQTLERAIRAAYDAKDEGKTYWAGPQAPAAALERVGATTSGESGRSAERESISPGESRAVVVDAQIEEAAARDDFSTDEFGNMSDEVSEVTQLTPELLAAAQLGPEAGTPSHSPTAAPTGKRVLVVDDEEDIRKLVRKVLVDRGHEVLEADRGLLALRIVKEETPDLIILDAMLPELHGFDIARRIRGSERYGAIPILMMSAVYRGWRVAADLKANYGIEEYLEKPFKLSELGEKVARLLDRGQAPPADAEEIRRAAAKHLDDGIEAYRAGDVDLAIEFLRKGIAIDPLAYRLRYHLALIYGKRGQFYDGITELERAVELNPGHFPALKNLAVLYEKAGLKNKAVAMWERCVHGATDQETRESIKAHLARLL
jgi:DNA-binding response OmpR family regulator